MKQFQSIYLGVIPDARLRLLSVERMHVLQTRQRLIIVHLGRVYWKYWDFDRRTSRVHYHHQHIRVVHNLSVERPVAILQLLVKLLI